MKHDMKIEAWYWLLFKLINLLISTEKFRACDTLSLTIYNGDIDFKWLLQIWLTCVTFFTMTNTEELSSISQSDN